MVRILGLGGALRDGSTSLAGLRVALDAAAAAGAETRLLALHELPLPLYRPDFAAPADYGPEAAARVERLIEAARWADGFLWSSPAYHGALSGALKNALDFLQFLARDEPSFLYGKVVGAIGAGGGTIGAVNVVNQLAQIAQALRAQVVPLLVPITFSVKAFDDGRATDAQVGRRLQSLGAEVVALAAVGAARRAASTAR
jgi:FMN reductase